MTKNGTRKDFLRYSSFAALAIAPTRLLATTKSTKTNQPPMKASSTSSNLDFDFYIGKWKIRNKKLKKRFVGSNEWVEFEATDNVSKILDGVGNFGQYNAVLDSRPFAGITLRLFNAQTKLWSLYWADSIHGKLDIPVIGSFENKIGRFYCKDIIERRSVDVQFKWDATDNEHPVWSQAFSIDNQETWEWNWYMYNERIS